jgi:P pilus assembly chaperone PapD
LDGSGRLGELLINPQAFLDAAIAAIKNSLQDLLVQGIEYHEINGQRYEMTLWDDVETYLSSVYPPAANDLTPPVSKIQPASKQTLRISYTGENLPAGQESLFYLNILNLAPASEIKDGQNSMRLNARSRFKIFFRPAALSVNPLDAAQQLVWRLDAADPAARLTANNPSPYFLSLVRVRLMRGQQVLQELDSGMAAPFGSASFPLQAQGSDPRGATSIQYQYIDDYGLHRDFGYVLNTPE